MNDPLVLSCIRHIESLDEGAVVNMGDKLLEVPGVIIPVRAKSDPRHKHAVVLNDAAADVDLLMSTRKYDTCLYVGRYAQATVSEATESLRAALYLYAIHYPGLVIGVMDVD